MGFFDPQLYESMRQIIVDSTALSADEFEALSLTFQVSMREEMGGNAVELVPNGAEKDVTPENVYRFVELHAQHVMVEAMRPELEAIRDGLHVRFLYSYTRMRPTGQFLLVLVVLYPNPFYQPSCWC